MALTDMSLEQIVDLILWVREGVPEGREPNFLLTDRKN